eukprot:TRINITY_DN36956_c0_g1_i1.p1 TRINITY_DN36956_c0_g1~~TRINITY_DN36956_c0_g1_i1.p1  ORF type:complete len:343 (+),score=66.79 TRINITY_DN36956_c0_g1_i1:65-1093(+)
MPLALDDLEDTFTGSGSWVTDPTGTIRHVPTGARFSEESGISVEGQEYKLTPADIELDTNTRLGAGASGVVQKGIIKKTGQQVAIKGIKIEGKDKKEQLLNEVKNLVKASWCPNLVTWYGGFVSKSIVHVVLELMDLGSLKSLATKMRGGVPAPHLAEISASVMVGLDFLHRQLIVHRDIKPDNILHNSLGEVKLTDFGISRSLDATIAMAGTQIGTQIYMAPEMCMGESYNFAVDIWSYGLVLYELASGEFPFPSLTNFPQLFQCICEKPEPRLDPDVYPPDLANFVAVCLTREVDQRYDTPRLIGLGFVAEHLQNPGGVLAITPHCQQDLANFFRTTYGL